MEKKSLTIFVTLVLVMLLSSFASGLSAAGSTQVATDPANDITKLAFGSTGESDQSKPVIDILSLSYGLDSNGNATLTMTLGATPTPNNETFYWVDVTDDSGDLSAFAWSGAYDSSGSSTDCSFACTYLLVGSSFGVQTSNATISGNSITWTFPNTIMDFSSGGEVPANMPSTPNATWTYTAIAWTGTTPYSSAQTGGTWWEDILDSTDSSNAGTDTATTSGNDTSGSTGLPGFDFVPVITFLSVSSVAALVQAQRRKKNF